MANRQAATKELLKWIEKILPGSENTTLWKERLEGMSEAEFEAFMTRLESGEEVVSLIVPNLDKSRISVERNLEIAKELGHEFFERLWLTDPHTGETYLTPVKYLIVDLPLRRQVQSLFKKISIPENNDHVDVLTGQVTGVKVSKLSFPEIQVLYAQGLNKSITELIKYRGGDEEGFRAMNRAIMETGGVSLDSLAETPTRTKSVETLSTLFKAMHLDNTL